MEKEIERILKNQILIMKSLLVPSNPVMAASLKAIKSTVNLLEEDGKWDDEQ